MRILNWITDFTKQITSVVSSFWNSQICYKFSGIYCHCVLYTVWIEFIEVGLATLIWEKYAVMYAVVCAYRLAVNWISYTTELHKPISKHIRVDTMDLIFSFFFLKFCFVWLVFFIVLCMSYIDMFTSVTSAKKQAAFYNFSHYMQYYMVFKPWKARS